MYPPPLPRRGVRLKWILWGVLLVLVGLGTLITGAVITLVSQTAASLDPVAEARTPGTASFIAEDGGYQVLLRSSRRDDRQSAAAIDCTVTLADGRIIVLDGAVQAVSSEAANISTIGRFDAVAGQTSVTCTATGDNQFLVDPESFVDRYEVWLFIAGAAVTMAGAGLIVAGALRKRVV